MTPESPLRFSTGDTLYTPYYNEWNRAAYHRTRPFDEMPFEVEALSTSGAPVVIDETRERFVSLTRPCEARFRWDGAQLEIQAPTDAVFIREGDSAGAWAKYHALLGFETPVAPHGGLVEYCTWVEQVWDAHQCEGGARGKYLTRDSICHFLDTIAQNDWPQGRFTVDAGWQRGFRGDWQPRPDMNLTAISQEIETAGHVPGLWLSPALMRRDSDAAQRQPSLVGPHKWHKHNDASDLDFYLVPGEEVAHFYRELLAQVWEWGFRKVKLDIFYGPRAEMIELHRLIAEAAALLPGVLELEGHIPDPFAARFCHVVRLNDVLISPEHPAWREVAAQHFQVCRESAPRHLLNLDHIGGNDVALTEALYLEHLDMEREQMSAGYPVVSLLPHRLGERATRATTDLLRDYMAQPAAASPTATF